MADPTILEGLKKYINNKQRQILVRKAQKEMEAEQELNTLLRQTVQTKDGRPQLPPIPTPEEAANLDFPSQEEMGMSDNEYRQFMFEQGVYKDQEGFKQLPADLNIQRRRQYEGEDIPDPNSMYNEAGEMPSEMREVSANVETKGKTLDTIQSTLDAAGMLSGPFEPVGIGADALNTLISASRGNVSDAALSALAMVPGLGLIAGTTKKAKKARIKIDSSGNIIKDKNFSDSFDALSREIEEKQISELSKRGRREVIRDEGLERRQVERLIKKIRSSKTIQDIKDVLEKFN